MKKILILAVLFVLGTSCNKDELSRSKKNSEDIKPIISYNPPTQTTLLNFSPTVYGILGAEADVECVFHEFQENPLSSIEAQVSDNSPSYPILVSNIQLSSASTYSPSNFNGIFGSTVNFAVGNTNPTYQDLYIPERISIVSPPIVNQDDLFPFCYFDNMQIEWNDDSQNDNGIVVIVEWIGSMYANPDVNGVHIRNIDILEDDDGIEVLNNQIFEDIPEDAIATLTLLRGNFDLVQYQTDTVKIGGQSIASLPFILVRDMSHYN